MLCLLWLFGIRFHLQRFQFAKFLELPPLFCTSPWGNALLVQHALEVSFVRDDGLQGQLREAMQNNKWLNEILENLP